MTPAVVCPCFLAFVGILTTSDITFAAQLKSFNKFSNNLLQQSDLDEFSVEKGASISSSFGIGYMLANINEKVWNVSNEGLEKVLQSSGKDIAEEYKELTQLLEKSGMSISSSLFTRDANISSKLSAGSHKLKTETSYVNFVNDWRSSWIKMNEKIANMTHSNLDDQLIPKGGWWGGAFYFFTEGAFINTNHLQNTWKTELKEIGVKKFYDGYEIPYFETESEEIVTETNNYTAISIPLKGGNKSLNFVIPKYSLVDFLRTEMFSFVQRPDARTWNSTSRRKIQIPAINITLLDQHYKKLEALGARYTFCVDEPESLEVAMKKGSYFMGPIVQSHHVRFTKTSLEISTATGSSVNSEEQMKAEIPLFHELYESELNQSVKEDSEADEPLGTTGELTGGSEILVPIDIGSELAEELADGKLEVKKIDVIVGDKDGKNDTVSASASSVEEISVVAPTNVTTSTQLPNVTMDDQNVDDVEAEDETTEAVTTTSRPSLFVSEDVPENTIRLDRPFFWYLFDESVQGPLYYGTIHSLATYQQEYGIETDEDLWLYDAYKTLLWNCP